MRRTSPGDRRLERFVADRWSATGGRLYGTGDRGRWRADGLLEHLGRLDSQVKVRGYRIEPGEIEANLAAHPSVAQAVVVVREVTASDVRLVAYVCARGPAPTDQQLREHLRARLPSYMIPQEFVAVSSIPTLPNGKIDRAALPAPGLMQAQRESAVRPPLTRTKSLLAQIWRDLLKVADVRADDNFFDLGGHSMLVMQAAFQMEAQCRKRVAPNRYIFETLGQIARAYDEVEAAPVRKAGGLRGILAGLIGGGKRT